MTLKCVQQQPSSNRITYHLLLCEVIALRWERFVSISVMRGNGGVTIRGKSTFIQLPFTGFLVPASDLPVLPNRKSTENHLCSSMGNVLHKTLSAWGRSALAVDMGTALEVWIILGSHPCDGTGSEYNCLKGSIRPQKILWEGVMFHLYLWEKYDACYLIEVLVRPDLLLRKGGIVFPGRGVRGQKKSWDLKHLWKRWAGSAHVGTKHFLMRCDFLVQIVLLSSGLKHHQCNWQVFASWLWSN